MILQGELGFSTVLALRKQGLNYIQQTEKPVFDLKAVNKADSAGVALLLEWWRAAHQLQKPIQFLNIPSRMQALMKVSNVDEVLR